MVAFDLGARIATNPGNRQGDFHEAHNHDSFSRTRPYRRRLCTGIARTTTPAGTFEQTTAQRWAQAAEHEAMVAAYKANTSLSTEKNRASTIGHCEYFVTTFKELAVKSQELAKLHEQMAKDVEQK